MEFVVADLPTSRPPTVESFDAVPAKVGFLDEQLEPAVRERTHRDERRLVNSGVHRPIDQGAINLAPNNLKYGPAASTGFAP